MPSYQNLFLYSCLGLLLLTTPVTGFEGGSRLLPISPWEQSADVSLVGNRSSATTIRNIRAHRHKKFTRVVLDLTHVMKPAPHDHRTATKFQLELPNTTIRKKLIAKTTGKTFPLTIQVSATPKGSVLLTIPTKNWKRYKWYILHKPHRIVLDLYPGPSSTVAKKPKTLAKAPNPPASAPTTPLPPPKRDMVIVIDPGHGGKDPGALGRKGAREKDIVLKIANRLRKLLRKGSSAKIFMTRESDTFVKLEDRAAFANTHKADLFISIHINSHPKRSIKGLELYHFGEASDPRALEVAARENGTPLEDNAPEWQFILADKLHDKKFEDSLEFAWTTKKALVKYLKPFYKIKDHGVKTAPFFVLRMTTMPAILTEIAFISNPTEEKLLTSSTYQKRMAQGIFEGIKAYITPLQTASR